MKTTYPSAVELLQRLTPDELRARLAALDAERRALLVLLRSALRRQASPDDRRATRGN